MELTPLIFKNILSALDDGGHSERVSRLVYNLSQEVGLDKNTSNLFSLASRYHDIGKLMILRHLLESVQLLSPGERKMIERHISYGHSMLTKYRGTEAETARTIITTHHEHWGGNGYPRGLRGEEIPLCGRITAVCDVYDALTSDRPYRSAWPTDMAVQYIRQRSGMLFDPNLVEPFLRVVMQPVGGGV